MIEDLVSKAGRQPGALAAVGQQQGEGGRGDPVETGAKGGGAPYHKIFQNRFHDIMIPKLPLKKYFLSRYFQFFPKMFQICRVKEGVVEVIETLQLGGGSGFAESQLQLGNARYLVMPSFLLSFSRATAKYGSGNLINICHHHPVGSTLSTALVYT